MLCAWCGEEVSDGSSICENCGRELESEATTASVDENAEDASGTGSADRADGEGKASASGESDASLVKIAKRAKRAKRGRGRHAAAASNQEPAEEGGRFGGYFSDYDASFVEPFIQSPDDEPTVYLPAPPEQPILGKGRTAIVIVIATLFAVAIVLLVVAILVRVLGI